MFQGPSCFVALETTASRKWTLVFQGGALVLQGPGGWPRPSSKASPDAGVQLLRSGRRVWQSNEFTVSSLVLPCTVQRSLRVPSGYPLRFSHSRPPKQRPSPAQALAFEDFW